MKYLITFLIAFSITAAYGQQTEKEKAAYEIGLQAVKCLNEEKYEEAIGLLTRAQELDPIRIIYPFEVAYAQYNLKEFGKAIDILEELKNRQDVTDHVFQLLGNSYDRAGNPDKAIETYHKGLIRFPSSGHLYLELGVVKYSQENYQEAIMNWETGIRVQPDYASNYYWLGRTFSLSNKRIWGILYGELFMLLEPASKRSGEISQMLFKTYDASIHFDTDSTLTGQLLVGNSEKNVIPVSFDSEVQLITAMSSVKVSGNVEGPLTIHELVEIRKTFIDTWRTMNLDDKYSNCLFDFYEAMEEAGVFEAYNYWLFRMGDTDNFKAWHKNNEEKYKEFVRWFNENIPTINNENLLVRE